MPEFHFVEHATVSPTVCFFCRTHGGPFIDSKTEEFNVATDNGPILIHAHAYVCMGCANTIGVLSGLVDRRNHDNLIEALEGAGIRIDELEEELHDLQELRDMRERMLKA